MGEREVEMLFKEMIQDLQKKLPAIFFLSIIGFIASNYFNSFRTAHRSFMRNNCD